MSSWIFLFDLLLFKRELRKIAPLIFTRIIIIKHLSLFIKFRLNGIVVNKRFQFDGIIWKEIARLQR